MMKEPFLNGLRTFTNLARQPDRILRGIGLGSTAGMVALLVHSAFDFNLRIPSNATRPGGKKSRARIVIVCWSLRRRKQWIAPARLCWFI